MNHSTNDSGQESQSVANAHEDALLETALVGSDQLLQNALRADERRRRWRRGTYFTLIAGGIVMGTVLLAVLAGWLTLFTPPPAERGTQAGQPQPSQQESKLQDEWVARLTGLRDHMHTAFGVGPDLTLVDPDQGLEIMRAAWPKITRYEVKTGLLKTFAFSKALPEKHSKVLQVLDLGMNDRDPKVRQYAAGYLEEYSGKNFASDPKGYKAWFAENGTKDPNELLKQRAADKLGGGSPDELMRTGWELWNAQKFGEAAKSFEQAARLNPRSADAWNGLGWSRFNGGDSEGAVEGFEKCVELQRNHPAGLNGLGQVYLLWGELDKAEKYLARAAKSPGASAAWFGLARIYLLTGKYDKAVVWIRKGLQAEGDHTMLEKMREAAEKKELPEDLKQQLQPAGKPANTPATKAAAEGWQKFNAGDLSSAELSFNRALAKDPENLSAMNGLGFLLLNSGKTAEAKEYFEKCLQKEPDAAGPMNGLARCLKEEGKVDEAIALWEKMHKKYPGPNAAAVGLATTYLERKEYDKAIPYFEELLKAQPDNAEFKKGLEEARQGAQKK